MKDKPKTKPVILSIEARKVLIGKIDLVAVAGSNCACGCSCWK